MKSFACNVLAAVVISVVVSGAIVMLDHQQSETSTKAIIEKVITENPDLIMKAMHDAQIRKRVMMVAKVASEYSLIENDLKDHPNFPVGGNPAGDVTLIEFFDYHCGYCKHFAPTLKKLVDQDHNLRVVFKDFPILSEDSETLAKAALAVNRIDPSKYFAFHMALMESKESPTPAILAQMVKDLGIDPAKFTATLSDKSLDDEIKRNKELGKKLTLNFTPAVIVGNELLQSNLSLDDVKAEVTKARSKAVPHS